MSNFKKRRGRGVEILMSECELSPATHLFRDALCCQQRIPVIVRPVAPAHSDGIS